MSKSKKSKMEKKRRGFFGIFFGVILWTLLIVIVAAASLTGYIWIDMIRDPVETLALEEYEQSAPDPEFRHLSFSEDGRMTQSYDEGDIGYFCAQYMKKENIDLESYIADYPDIQLKGIRIELNGDGAGLCAEGAYKRIRLVARLNFTIEMENGLIRTALSDVNIAGIRIPVSLIDWVFKTHIARESLDYEPELAVLESIEKLEVGDGVISISGPMSTKMLDDSSLPENRIRIMRLSQKDVRYVGALLDSDDSDPAVRYSPMLPVLMEDPDQYTEFLDQLFRVRSATFVRQLGIGWKNYKMAMRWYPEFDEWQYEKIRESVYDEYYVCFRFLKTIASKLSDAWSSGRIQEGSSGLTYGGGSFSFTSFFGSDYRLYRPFFGLDDAKLCICRTSGTSSRIGILTRGTDGFGYVVVCEGYDDYRILPLREEVFTGYMNSTELVEILLYDTDQFAVKV